MEQFQPQGSQGTIFDLIPPILNFLIGLGALIAAIMLIYAGVIYLTSAGDQKKTDIDPALEYGIKGILIKNPNDLEKLNI